MKTFIIKINPFFAFVFREGDSRMCELWSNNHPSVASRQRGFLPLQCLWPLRQDERNPETHCQAQEFQSCKYILVTKTFFQARCCHCLFHFPKVVGMVAVPSILKRTWAVVGPFCFRATRRVIVGGSWLLIWPPCYDPLFFFFLTSTSLC